MYSFSSTTTLAKLHTASPWAIYYPWPNFVKKVLLKYSYIHLIMYHLCPPPPTHTHYSSGVKYLWQKLHGPQNPKYLLLDTLQKICATSVLEYPLVLFVCLFFNMIPTLLKFSNSSFTLFIIPLVTETFLY